MSQSDTIPVRQHAYALLNANSGASKLETHKVNFCTAFCGVNKKKGIAFLTHLDVPSSAKAIDEICYKLENEYGGLNGFELRYASLVGPFTRILLSLGCGALAWDQGQSLDAYIRILLGLFTSAVAFWYFAWPQLRMYVAAKRRFQCKVTRVHLPKFRATLGTIGMKVDLASSSVFEVTWDGPAVKKEDWSTARKRESAGR